LSPRVVTHAQVVQAGTAYFLQHAHLDVDELASTMAVSRSTLYRVIGSRDRLFGDVLDLLSARAFSHVIGRGMPTGPAHLLDVIAEYVRYVSSAQAFRQFLREEPELAFRILFMPEARVHVRQVARVRDLLNRAGVVPAAEQALLDDIAFAVVRLAESMIYTDLLVGREPNARITMHLISTLLHSPWAAAGETAPHARPTPPGP